MNDDDQEETAAPARRLHRCRADITVAGHSISVEAVAELGEVTAAAADLFDRTAAYARQIPAGFAAGPPHLENAVLADPSGRDVRIGFGPDQSGSRGRG